MNYDEMVDRYKSLKNRGVISDAAHIFKSNFSCGDSIHLYIKIDGDKISDAKFDGKGCVLSMVSADLLCDYLIGKDVSELRDLSFSKLVDLLGFTPSVGRKACIEIIVDAAKSTYASEYDEND